MHEAESSGLPACSSEDLTLFDPADLTGIMVLLPASQASLRPPSAP